MHHGAPLLCSILFTLVPRTLFWPWCRHGTWVANWTLRASTWSPLTFKYLSHCGTKACILDRRNLYKVSVVRTWHLFHGICWGSPAGQLLLKGSKKMEITGHKTKTGGRMTHVKSQYHNKSQIWLAIWGPVISTQFPCKLLGWKKDYICIFCAIKHLLSVWNLLYYIFSFASF